MDPTLAAFLGAIIGAGSSIAAMQIQQYHQTKRDRVKVASELAIKDYENDIDLAKNTQGGAKVAPISAYVIYHANVLEELSKGKIDADKIKKITEEKRKIENAFPGAPQ